MVDSLHFVNLLCIYSIMKLLPARQPLLSEKVHEISRLCGLSGQADSQLAQRLYECESQITKE